MGQVQAVRCDGIKSGQSTYPVLITRKIILVFVQSMVWRGKYCKLQELPGDGGGGFYVVLRADH